ncbi:hypothetical protein HYV72_01195, partial [Candidatus Uhrbacteria bacterium]|nr:hypothetical protein [Candidatus Uhrbacteria bacterium]
MNKFKTHLLALVAVLTVGFTAINPNPATAQSFVDTDGDGLNDRAEDRRCIGDAGQSRGGYVDEAGCTGEFVACVQARPNSYFTCGASASWNDIGLKGFLDAMTYVVESNGTRHQLVHDHLPKWEGGRGGGWQACGDDSLIMHVGDHALVKGKSVKTGLPSQTPPFCHPTVMKTSGAAGGGLDKKTREQISG